PTPRLASFAVRYPRIRLLLQTSLLSSLLFYFHSYSFLFFFNDTATTEIYTLSLHDALPISVHRQRQARSCGASRSEARDHRRHQDRKSTRLNSSHGSISYAVFCLKKKKNIKKEQNKRRIDRHRTTTRQTHYENTRSVHATND